MKIDFENKKSDGRILINKKIYGIGFRINFCTPSWGRDIFYVVEIDFIFIRFWLNKYRK